HPVISSACLADCSTGSTWDDSPVFAAFACTVTRARWKLSVIASICAACFRRRRRWPVDYPPAFDRVVTVWSYAETPLRLGCFPAASAQASGAGRLQRGWCRARPQAEKWNMEEQSVVTAYRRSAKQYDRLFGAGV